jgi:hypothetical protein
MTASRFGLPPAARPRVADTNLVGRGRWAPPPMRTLNAAFVPELGAAIGI